MGSQTTGLVILYLQEALFLEVAFTIFWRELHEKLEDPCAEAFRDQALWGRAYRIVKYDAGLEPVPHFEQYPRGPKAIQDPGSGSTWHFRD